MAEVGTVRSKQNALLRLRGKLTLRRYTKETGRIIGLIIGVSFFLPMTILIGVGSWAGYTLAPDHWPTQLLGAVLVGLWLIWIILPLIAASVSDSIDLDNLLIYPLTRRDLVVSNVLGTIFDFQTFIALPIFVAILIGFGGFGFLSNAEAGLHLLPIVLIVCAISYGLMVVSSQLLLTLLGGILQSRRTRDVALILVSILGTSCWAISQPLPNMIGNTVLSNLTPDQVMNLRPLNLLQWLPPGALAKAVEQILADQWGSALLWVAYALLWLVGLSWAWGTLLERLLTGQGFLLGSGSQRAMQDQQKRRTWGLAWLSGLVSAETRFIAAKELKSLWRVPQRRILLLQAFVMPFMILFFPILRFGGSMSIEEVATVSKVIVPAYTLMLIWFIGQNMLGWENSGLPTLLTMPIERWRIFLGKSIAYLLIGVPPLLLIGTALTVWTGDLQNLLWALLGLLMALPALAVQAVSSVYFPYPVQLNFKTNRNSFSRGGCLASLAILILVPFASVLLNIPMIMTILIASFAPSLAWVGLISAAFSVLWAPFVFWRGMKLAGRVLSEREPEVVAAAKPTIND